MKIVGNTVGMGLPKPNLMQTNPKKGDFVKGKEEFLEQVGSGGNVDLTGYATEQFVRDGFQSKGDYALRSEIPTDDDIATAVVSYLEENPVQGGGGEAWDILLNVTTEEEVASVSATTPPDGHTFDEYTEIFLMLFMTPNASYTTGAKLSLNSKNPWGGAFTLPIGGITSGAGQLAVAWLERKPFGWYVKAWDKSNNNGSMNNAIIPATIAAFGAGPVTATYTANSVPDDMNAILPNYPISAIGVGGYQAVLGVGSKVIVYGKRAV